MEENKNNPQTQEKIDEAEIPVVDAVPADDKSDKKEEKKKKSVFRKIVDVFSTVILVIALLILGFAMYSRLTGGNASFFGYNFYLVLTDSMTPEIQVDELVIAKQVDKSELKVGDDIVFVSKNPDSRGVNLVHRIIRIEGGTITTRGIKLNGDGSPLPEDQPITEVLGKVVYHSQALGVLPAAFTRHPQIAFGILIGVMALLVLLLFVDVIKAFMMPADGEKPSDNEKADQKPLSDSEKEALEAREMAKEEVNRVFYDCDDPISPDETAPKTDETDEQNNE